MAVAGGSTAGLRANRNWRRLLLGQAVSMTGDIVFDVTVMLWISTVIARGKPWAPAAVAGALVAAAIPALAVGPFAGVYVDRWNRRRTMMTADAARALLIGALILLPAAGHHIPAAVQVSIIYAVVAAASCFAQFFNPSRMAIIGAVVDPADLPKASGQLQASAGFATIIGPPIAAPLLFVAGVQWALIINALSFAVSFLMLHGMRVAGSGEAAREPGASFLEEFRAGVRFFRSSPVLITITVGVVIATLGTGALNSLMVFFVPYNLHVGAKWLGTLIGAIGVGAIAGSLLAGPAAKRVPPARLFWLGLVLAGIGLIGFSRCTTLPVAIVVIAVIGLIVGMLNSVTTPLLLGATPQHLLGRVSAVINPVQELASISSMAAAGFLASTVLRGMHEVVAGVSFGPYDTIFAVSGLLFVIAGFASIAPMRGAAQPAAEAAAADEGDQPSAAGAGDQPGDAGLQGPGPVSPAT